MPLVDRAAATASSPASISARCASARAAAVSMPSATSRCVRRRRIAPEHGTAGGALAVLQARRLLRIARLAVGADAELGFAGAAGAT